MAKKNLPPCGLYKTGQPISIGDQSLHANLLVYFHGHSPKGPPILLPPEKNVNNKWSFQKKGWLIEDDETISSLIVLKPEGLYRVGEEFNIDDKRVVSRHALVQLGYNQNAEALLFFPKGIPDQNAFSIPSKGIKITDKIYAQLEALDVRGPVVIKTEH